MIITGDVKKYLNIPGDYDDLLINQMIKSAYAYLENAIDDFKEKYEKGPNFRHLADVWVLYMYMPDAYDQREGGYDGKRAAMNYPSRALLTQLQFMGVGE